MGDERGGLGMQTIKPLALGLIAILMMPVGGQAADHIRHNVALVYYIYNLSGAHPILTIDSLFNLK